ncbi:MAG: HAD family phosphatase [Chthoniobacterales bacterium]|nr:HAD family phosphatase [Chthoniobacterales bacterium]
MIEAAIFDIGNVLLRFNYSIAIERLRLINALRELPENEPLVQAQRELESGRMSREGFLAQAMLAFGHTESEEMFLEVWSDIFYPNWPMVEFARALAPHMPLYLLSNISCIHHDYIFRKYEFFSLFRDGAFSYQLGCLKPDPLIYQKALDRFHLQPHQVVLFDDIAENVAAARACGWTALEYDYHHHTDFLRQVQALGLTFAQAAATSSSS